MEITERDYQQREGQGNNIINARVSFSRDLVNNIIINFLPVTYANILMNWVLNCLLVFHPDRKVLNLKLKVSSKMLLCI